MKVKWTSLVADLKGGVGSQHYARHIPGNGEWAAVCQNPELSKKTKKKKAMTRSVVRHGKPNLMKKNARRDGIISLFTGGCAIMCDTR